MFLKQGLLRVSSLISFSLIYYDFVKPIVLENLRGIKGPVVIRPPTEEEAHHIIHLGLKYIHATKQLGGYAIPLVLERMTRHSRYKSVLRMEKEPQAFPELDNLRREMIDHSSGSLLDAFESDDLRARLSRRENSLYDSILSTIRQEIRDTERRGIPTNLVVEHEGEIKGWAGYSLSSKTITVVVRRHMRGSGVGTKLMEALLGNAFKEAREGRRKEVRTLLQSTAGRKTASKLGAEIIQDSHGNEWAVWSVPTE